MKFALALIFAIASFSGSFAMACAGLGGPQTRDDNTKNLTRTTASANSGSAVKGKQ